MVKKIMVSILEFFQYQIGQKWMFDCLIEECKKKNISIKYNKTVKSLIKTGSQWVVNFNDNFVCQFDFVIIASGGSPKLRGFEWLTKLGHSIVNPLPSLFTFNMPNESVTSLMGLVVANATVRIQASKLSYSGPVLITHWGMSGPAILKLSAWGARYLHDKNYQFKIQVNWLSIKSEVEVLNLLLAKDSSIRKKKICNANRLWQFLVQKLGVSTGKRWGELGKKKMRHLVELFTKDTYSVSGKTTFKEEFVTCGGIALSNINIKTMESKVQSGLYFAGEVIDVDAITGGYNFQAAWSGGYIAGKLN